MVNPDFPRLDLVPRLRLLLVGASLSEPHIDELNVRNLYIIIIIGASLSEPHIDELNVRNLYIIIITREM